MYMLLLGRLEKYLYGTKTLWVYFNQRKLLMTKHIKAEITKVAIGCFIFCVSTVPA